MGHPGLPAETGHRLTATEVRDAAFASVHFGGLNTDQVNRFMARIAAELDQLADEKLLLEQDNTQLREDAAVTGNGQANARSFGLEANYLLQRAQQNADQTVATGQEQARGIVDGARRQRDVILADGRFKAGRLIQESLDEASRQAAQILAQAPVTAQRQQAFNEAMAEASRAHLHAFIAALTASVRAFEEKEHQGAFRPQGPPSGPQPAMPPA
jgi:DivIVA domain-containing protein